ncbi:MAG TPA: V4R domain-containing protein [Gemmatimonadales bacterium]|jgi:predicted hydrocarbon binding protein|nr:V4R domain-containing protein [Gemmatimonadales bacterium]
MTTAASGAAGVIVGKRALHQMRAVLERETGAQAALLLREIGFATGAALWEAFEAWCREHYHVDAPSNLDSAYLAEALSGFFGEAGWGSVTMTELSPTVLALDMLQWAECEAHGAEYPSCHFSSGMLADFFTRLGGAQAAVMEVECASRGEPRCRFLVGSPDILTYVYERMTTGMSYAQAIA